MLKKIVLISLVTFAFLLPVSVFAQDDSTFQSTCQKVNSDDPTYGKFPKCAQSPAECATVPKDGEFHEPLNCVFLEEPIGGEPGYDLYKVTCGVIALEKGDDYICIYSLWHGEAIVSSVGSKSAGGQSLASAVERGPVQAILAYEEGKEYQGPFGLLYNYLGIIYKFMSGVIVGFVVLLSIIGGIEMTTSAGDQEKFRKGRSRITKALIGMALWFLASLILYTINPTFFAF